MELEASWESGMAILPDGLGDDDLGPRGAGSRSLLSLTVLPGGVQALELGLPPSLLLFLFTPSTPPSDNPFTYKQCHSSVDILRGNCKISIEVLTIFHFCSAAGNWKL